jgi:hypothetical protein
LQELPPVLLNPFMLDETNFVFSFGTRTDRTYSVEWTDSLEPANWNTLTNLPGDGTVLSVTNENLNGAQRFYRIQTQ